MFQRRNASWDMRQGRWPRRSRAPCAGMKKTATCGRGSAAPSLLQLSWNKHVKVLVAYAVEAEFAPWRKLRELQRVNLVDLEIHQTTVGRALVDFVVTGMGYENAYRVAKTALQRDYSICMVSGFSGALHSRDKVGDIVTSLAVQRLGKSKTLQCHEKLARAAMVDGAKLSPMFLT